MKRLVSICLAFSGLALIAAAARNEPPKTAEEAIDSAGLLQHIKVLGSDNFEGRAPGSAGEKRSVEYITEQFKKLGLKPGNPDGTYTQEVPLAGIITTPSATFKVGEQSTSLHSPEEFVAFTSQITPRVEVKNSGIVFVGYGVIAPEYGWDDFKGADLKGKTLVFLINDPPIASPNDSSQLDEKMFKGKAMT